ncbi:MAG: response regulator transcription factor [Oscillospiraceae bacterium]|nr:response regulator transcription factor [Oscillospiraceae bacterium]
MYKGCDNVAKIIVADDEQLIRRLVSDFLKKDGYTVLEAENGEEALRIFENNKDTDLLVLDIMMPQKDGWEVCREIRKTSNVPILLLSARSQEFDQINGFEAGADDYVTKPFSPVLLVKRVEALLKRTNNNAKSADGDIQGLTIDKNAHQVFIDGKEISLTVKEFNILLKLIDNKGRVYSREQLLDDIWGFDYYGDTRTVDSHVARLRTKLGEWGNRHLKTVYGVGYKIQESDINEQE